MSRTFWKGDLDFFSGLLLVGIAAIALWFISGLEIGTARQMQTGFFPLGIAMILGAMGLFLVIRGIFVVGPRMEAIYVRPLVMILLSFAAFAIIVDRLGLVAAIMAQVAIASYAPTKTNLVESLLVGAAMAAGCAVVFVWLLGVPMKTFPW